MKTCITCGESKPLESFGKNKRYADGLMRICKPCWNAWAKAHRSQHDVTCIQCGKTWQSQNKNAKYCSNTCQATYEHGDDRVPKWQAQSARWRKARTKIRQAERGTHGATPWYEGPCQRCGARFTTRQGQTRYCSVLCKRADKASRRRARKAGAPKITSVQRFRVFERDQWICHICNDPINRDARVPDLDAPTIDHVVSLYAGGEHSENNLRAAHFWCNSVKREMSEAV